MSVFDVDLGQIIARAEARRSAIAAVQRKFEDLSAVAHSLESELKFIAELGKDVKALDSEAQDLLGRQLMGHMTMAGLDAESVLKSFFHQGASLRQVLINMGTPPKR